jgi:hypothetical protein
MCSMHAARRSSIVRLGVAVVVALCLLSSTLASVAASPGPAPVSQEFRYFPQTGHWVSHGFLHYWNQFGGLAVFGYPLSEEVNEDPSGTGTPTTVQYFERARFEWHPGAWPDRYDVLLGLLGVDQAQRQGLLSTPPFQRITATSDANCTYYAATGHRLCFGFRTYWQSHGGLSIFGYPISEEYRDPATGYTVQYFERQRFEYHPENSPAWQVEGGLLGAQLIAATGKVFPAVPFPTFTSSVATVSTAQRNAMLSTGSWRDGCPVPISDLRVLSLSYWGFDGGVHTGQLMVNADVAQPVIQAFRSMFAAQYPIRRMELVENFGADDEQSMLADNTSGFNCRGVPGSTAWSQHAYGRAIDLNPFENPEVRNGAVDPPEAARYVDRSLNDIGVIHPNDAAVRAFASIGWPWGGDWTALKDYQHFSLTGD